MEVRTLAAETLAATYYAVLQVHPDAEPEVIEAAYRQLMKRYHPDLAGHDPERMAMHHQRAKSINKAFSVLRDPEQRLLYDAPLEVPARATDAGFARSAPDGGPSAYRRVTPDAPPRASTAQTTYTSAEFTTTPSSGLRTPFWRSPSARSWRPPCTAC